MRYLFIKPEVEVEAVGDAKVMLGYKRLLTEMLCVDCRLNTEQFLRLGSIFTKLKDVQEGDTVELEDQDYAIIKLKLDAYVPSLRGPMASVSTAQEFVKEVMDLPTTKPEKVVLEVV